MDFFLCAFCFQHEYFTLILYEYELYEVVVVYSSRCSSITVKSNLWSVMSVAYEIRNVYRTTCVHLNILHI